MDEHVSQNNTTRTYMQYLLTWKHTVARCVEQNVIKWIKNSLLLNKMLWGESFSTGNHNGDEDTYQIAELIKIKHPFSFCLSRSFSRKFPIHVHESFCCCKQSCTANWVSVYYHQVKGFFDKVQSKCPNTEYWINKDKAHNSVSKRVTFLINYLHFLSAFLELDNLRIDSSP